MARFLVIGASSGIGAQVVQQATAANHFVRAMSRSGKVPDGVHGDYESVKGNALDEADVESALVGVDVAVQTIGISASLKMVTEPVTLFSDATRILVQQMTKSGPSRLISVTGFGAGDSQSSINILQRIPFKLLLGNAYDDKSIQEKLISESKLDWLIVRPGVLLNGGRSDNYKVLLEREHWRNGFISRADVANFIVSQVGHDGYSRKKPVLIRYPL